MTEKVLCALTDGGRDLASDLEITIEEAMAVQGHWLATLPDANGGLVLSWAMDHSCLPPRTDGPD